MNRNKCVIAVPLYKTEFNWDEYNSIKQLFKILPIEKYDIIAFCPDSLDVSYYNDNFKFKRYYGFWDSYFENYPNGYNSLLLNPGFYEYFDNYEYMLIYQPDCWVFRDELEYWVNREYDYIGAPFIYRIPDLFVSKTFIGNGGLSLRKISTFINICNKYAEICSHIGNLNDKEFGEDHIFLKILDTGVNIKFNLPSLIEAARFSFDTNPFILYQITECHIPFVCHAYKKIEYNEFWDNFICYDKKSYSVVTFLFGDYDDLRDPLYVDEDAEYICITDRTDLQSNVWKFENITEYDISNYTDWQKSMIARYTALNHINTDQCVIIDCSIEIKKSLKKFVFNNTNADIGLIIHPFRESMLDEMDEWINTRNIDPLQKENLIDYCNKHNFDINSKGFIMSTIMFIRKTELTINMMNFILNELMNNYNFSMRVDQLYFSIIFSQYFINIQRYYFSYQILNSSYFNYYYHKQNITHKNDYITDLSKVEIRKFANNYVICKYLT